jgi:hypothetical protein
MNNYLFDFSSILSTIKSIEHFKICRTHEIKLKKNFEIKLLFLLLSNPVQSDLNSFIDTSRTQRVQSMISQSPRSTSYYPQFETQSEINFNGTAPLSAYSPDDLQKLKYKIDLGSIIFFL